MDNQINKTFAAEVLGVVAFHRGAKRIPAHDPECMELLRGNEIGDGLPVLDAWLRGWDQANLNAAEDALSQEAYAAMRDEANAVPCETFGMTPEEAAEERAYCAGIPDKAIF